jgi:hypothetical protein
LPLATTTPGWTVAHRLTWRHSGDADVFGSQQYGPLLDIEVPDE